MRRSPSSALASTVTLLGLLAAGGCEGGDGTPTLQQISPEARTHLSVQERGRVVLVPVKDVVYLRAELKYVTIRTAQREYLIEEPLLRLEQEFADRFVRIHRSCLVAREHVTGFEKDASEGGEGRWVVLLRGIEERLPVSRRQQHVVKELGRAAL